MQSIDLHAEKLSHNRLPNCSSDYLVHLVSSNCWHLSITCLEKNGCIMHSGVIRNVVGNSCMR